MTVDKAARVDGINEELDKVLAKKTTTLIELQRLNAEIDRLLLARAAAGDVVGVVGGNGGEEAT
jgi:hypothetical protein